MRRLLWLAFLLPGCPASCPAPTPGSADAAPPADALAEAPAVDWCPLACANLRAQGCREVLPQNCEATCRDVISGRVTALDPECIARAASRAEVRGCGGVRCSEP